MIVTHAYRNVLPALISRCVINNALIENYTLSRFDRRPWQLQKVQTIFHLENLFSCLLNCETVMWSIRERNSSRFVCAVTKLEFWKWNAYVLTLLGERCFWIKHVWLSNKQHTCWVINNFEMTSFFPSFPSHLCLTALFKINIKPQSLLISDIDANRSDVWCQLQTCE